MFRLLGESNSDGFFESFETLSAEQARQTLLEAWSTPEQRAYNASTVQCPSCRGWGYRVERRGREVVRDNCGCWNCGGTGKVPK